MASGQTLLNLMEVVFPELQLQAAEADVVKGLLALNVAQDFFESVIAQHPNVKGDTIGTVVTAASTESTAFPTGVLRIDRLQFIDPATSRPAWDLLLSRETGSHAYNRFWPYNLFTTSSPGRPRAYWTNGRSIYWDPLPDGVHTIRWYGFQVASDITAGGTFAYDDIVMFPLASFAAKLLKDGLDDPSDAVTDLAVSTFTPIVKVLSNFNRDGARSLNYRYGHNS
jgi:hypothetical protein